MQQSINVRPIFCISLKSLFLIVPLVAMLTLSCNLNPDNPDQPQTKPLRGFIVATGLVDSTINYPNTQTALSIHLSRAFNLSWESLGKACFYQVRFSTQPITAQSWNNASIAGTINDSLKEPVMMEYWLSTLLPRFDSTLCIQCGVCQNSCPSKCITIVENKVVINSSKCTHCGRCAQSCGFSALTTSLVPGKAYYFAIQAFGIQDTLPLSAVTATAKPYKMKYTNWNTICGYCGDMCYALKKVGGPGCPANALHYDSTNRMYIDPNACINCGVCLKACFVRGKLSIRRVVEEIFSHQ